MLHSLSIGTSGHVPKSTLKSLQLASEGLLYVYIISEGGERGICLSRTVNRTCNGEKYYLTISLTNSKDKEFSTMKRIILSIKKEKTKEIETVKRVIVCINQTKDIGEE